MADDHALTFTSSLGSKLVLTAVAGQEAISRPYSYRLELLCTDVSMKIDPQQIIGSAVSIGIQYKKQDFTRHGYVNSVQLGTQRGRSRVVRMEVTPKLIFLKQSTDFRIFQNVTVVDVLKSVFDEFQITPNKLTNLDKSKYPTLEYCVQCRETAFDFVSRLMEQNGIFYYFNHAGFAELVLGDSPQHFAQAQQSDVGLAKDAKDGFLTQLDDGYDLRPVSYEVGDFSFMTPTEPVRKNEPSYRLPPLDSYKRYYFPENLPDATEAARIATVRMNEEDAPAHVITATSDFPTFLPGFWFKISKTDNIPYGQPLTSYVVTSLTFTATDSAYNHHLTDILGGMLSSLWNTDTAKTTALGALSDAPTNTAALAASKVGSTLLGMLGGGLTGLAGALGNAVMGAISKLFEDTAQFGNQFTAVNKQIAFVPPRLTPKPQIFGPHLATVVGAKGPTADDGQDICTDSYGRVHVKFPWDRATTDYSKGTSSAWIRVAEGWAGSGWGTQFPPRVGQEVIVQFIDGDPDRPIITGRVYDGKNLQPFRPPGETPPTDLTKAAMQTSQRRSGIKTNSTPRPKGAKEKFNQIRFDDTWGKEQVAIRAQGRLDLFSFGTTYHTMGGSWHAQVGGIDPQTGETWGQFHGHIYDAYYLHIGRDRNEYCEQDYDLHIKQKLQLAVEDNIAVVGLADLSLAADSIVISASKKLTLSVGGNFIVIDSSGVAISGTQVQINGSGSPDSTLDAVIPPMVDPTVADAGAS